MAAASTSQTSQNVPSGLSNRVRDLHPSPIREILAMLDRPNMISFAGGLPAPETFPEFDLEFPSEILQYGASEGDSTLRRQIALDLGENGLPCREEQVLILSGSQQGIDLVAKLFIDPGTPVAVEAPTYLAALQVFRFFGARFVPYTADAQFGTTLAAGKPALAYVIPTFQNPTGHCYNAAQRQSFAEACDAQCVPVFEDDPYRDLAYDPCERTPICARLKKSPWIYQGSFSKTLAPGLRLGYLVASPELMPYLVRLKQAADLHSNRLSQELVLRQLQHPQRAERIANLAASYRQKRDIFAQALKRYFSDLATWETPPGGLFFWLKLNFPMDTRTILPQALANHVAFMPGEAFYPESIPAHGCLRLNFSFASEAQVEHGLQILAQTIRQAAKIESINHLLMTAE